MSVVFIVSDSGYQHIQGYAEFKNAVAYNRAKDLLDVGFVKNVPRIEKKFAMLYCAKLHTRMVNTEPKSYGIPSIDIFDKNYDMKNTKKNIAKNAWHDVLKSNDKKTAISLIKENFPEQYLCKKKVLMENLDSEFGHVNKSYFSKFNRPCFNVWDGKSHIFVGASNLGKTEFALHHFEKCVHIKGMQSFGRISNDANICDGVVIDDINISKLPSNELLGILDVARENLVNIKYSIGYIPPFLPRIVCVNNLSQIFPHKCSLEITQAITRRIIVHEIKTKLFDDPIDICHLQVPQRNKYRPRTGIVVDTTTVSQDVARTKEISGPVCTNTNT